MIFLNGKPLPVTVFPDKTSQVWKLDKEAFDKAADIEWRFEEEAEVLHLAQLADLLKSNGIPASLRVSYLPYARQDKDISNTTTFALHTFANILNSMDFWRVTILDPHSDVALKLINNSVAVYPVKEFNNTVKIVEPDMIIYADKGAYNKYHPKIYNITCPVNFAIKRRDPLTGHVELDPGGDVLNYLSKSFAVKKVLLVDDIIDGGATICGLAKHISKAGAEVYVFVTHPLLTKGMQVILDSGVKKVYSPKL